MGVEFSLALKMSVAAMNNILTYASTLLTPHETLDGTKWKSATERKIVKRWEELLIQR